MVGGWTISGMAKTAVAALGHASNFGNLDSVLRLLVFRRSVEARPGSPRSGAGSVKRGGLEMRLVSSRPVPTRTVQSGFCGSWVILEPPQSRSVPARAKGSGANWGAMLARRAVIFGRGS
jgi:hypothetical protein